MNADGDDGYYTIEDAERRVQCNLCGPYASLIGAAEALRAAMGWEEVFVGPAYPVARGIAYTACPSRGGCDVAAGRNQAPCVVRHSATTYTVALDSAGTHLGTVRVTPETASRVARALCEQELPDSALRRLPSEIADELFDAAAAVSAANDQLGPDRGRASFASSPRILRSVPMRASDAPREQDAKDRAVLGRAVDVQRAGMRADDFGGEE